MGRKKNKKQPPKKDLKPRKVKVSILTTESITYVDYKDVNLLRRFMSERAKIRGRRVTGNTAQQQRQVARAIRVAREMALLPYQIRQVTKRGGKGRRDRDSRDDSPPPTPSAPPPPPGTGDEAGEDVTDVAADVAADAGAVEEVEGVTVGAADEAAAPETATPETPAETPAPAEAPPETAPVGEGETS